MKKTFFSIVIFQLVFFVFLVSSYSQNILTITTANLDEDYIKIIETNNHTKPKFNKINMYIENGVIVISKKQLISLSSQDGYFLINGDSINNIGEKPIKVINSDGSEIFVAPGVKNRVYNNKLEIIKWYEFWK
jgi:hypothetical protein